MHKVLVNRLGGLSLPWKSVVRLTDRPDMTLDVYRGHKTTTQQQYNNNSHLAKSVDCFYFCKNGILVKNAYFLEQVQSLKSSTKIKTTILVCEGGCLIGLPTRNSDSETMFMMFNRPPRKKPQFQKIKKLQNLIHFNEQGISCIEVLVVSTFDASSKCCRRMEQSLRLVIKFMGR